MSTGNIRAETTTGCSGPLGSGKLGLVLEGGGAKGAFQFGCLKALNEAGIRFDVVAGTSVGALNGALWCTTQIRWGEEFWRTISFAKVYPLRKPYFLFMPIAIAYAAFRFIFNWIGRFPALNFVMMGLVFWMACLPLCCSFLSLPFFLISYFWTGNLDPAIFQSSNWCLALILLGPIIFVKCVEYFQLSAFTAQPLRTTLTSQLENKEFVCSLFATTSRLCNVYDPDNLQYSSTGIPASAALITPQPVRKYVPRYWQLDQEPASLVTRLLASAALPFGIVPAVDDQVDGGVADNLPILPVVSLSACDKVIIIRANAGALANKFFQDHWKGIERLLRIAKYDSGSAHEANPRPYPTISSMPMPPTKPGPAEPEADISNWPDLFVIDCPITKTWWLQDLLMKTMNFRPSFTIPLLDSGYDLTKEKLNSDLGRFLLAKNPI